MLLIEQTDEAHPVGYTAADTAAELAALFNTYDKVVVSNAGTLAGGSLCKALVCFAGMKM